MPANIDTLISRVLEMYAGMEGTAELAVARELQRVRAAANGTLREKIKREIVDSDWLDFWFKRGDRNARSFKTYGEWLDSLSDDDFLSSYNEVRDRSNQLD